jgi:hypothetical protein
MKITWWPALVVLCYLSGPLACGGVASAAGGKPYFDGRQSLYNQAPANEVAALPKYCWGKYIAKFKGPKFNISSKSCGVRHNHFCQGLLQFNRSQHPMATQGEKASYLHQATGNLEYTWNGIKDLPACPIRNHVKIAYRRALALKGVPN